MRIVFTDNFLDRLIVFSRVAVNIFLSAKIHHSAWCIAKNTTYAPLKTILALFVVLDDRRTHAADLVDLYLIIAFSTVESLINTAGIFKEFAFSINNQSIILTVLNFISSGSTSEVYGPLLTFRTVSV